MVIQSRQAEWLASTELTETAISIALRAQSLFCFLSFLFRTIIMALSTSAQPTLIPQPQGRTGIIHGARIPGQKITTWDHAIPPVLRPLVRAYLLGYASTVAPRLLTLVFQQLVKTRKKGRDVAATINKTSTTPNGAVVKHDAEEHPHPAQQPFLVALRHILRSGLDWQRFPTFCAALAGGSTLLEVCSSYVVSCHS